MKSLAFTNANVFASPKSLKRYEILCTLGVILMIVAAMFAEKISLGLCAVILMVAGLVSYLVLIMVSDNLFNFLGLMHAGFVCPMGLSRLCLATYQKIWCNETWICFLLAILCFSVGYICRGTVYNWFARKHVPRAVGREPDMGSILFCAVITLFVFYLSALAIKWYFAGALPIFDYRGAQTYADFLSGEPYMETIQKQIGSSFLFTLLRGYHRLSTVFYAQSWLCSCAALICIVKYNLSHIKKGICWAVIIICILAPTLTISREYLMMTTVSLAICGFFVFTRKKGLFTLLMLLVTCLCFFSATKGRNYSREAINSVFEMNSDKISDDSNTANWDGKTYPAAFVWVYTYFTGGYDNFNHLVKVLDFHTYGLMQARPIFTALQIEKLKDVDMLIQESKYRISPNITIYTFLCDSYVDFGTAGVAASMLLWGLIFGLVEKSFLCRQGDFLLLLTSALGHHLIFFGYVGWMGHFTYLCSFGLIFLLWLFVLLRRRKLNA